MVIPNWSGAMRFPQGVRIPGEIASKHYQGERTLIIEDADQDLPLSLVRWLAKDSRYRSWLQSEAVLSL